MQKKPQGHKKSDSKKYEGVIRVTQKPLGFVIVDQNEDTKKIDDIVVFEESLNCALDKDRVEVEVIGRDRDRFKGRVTRIIERAKTQFVGTLEKGPFGLTFKPDDFKFYKTIDLIEPDKKLEAGTKVLVKLENWNNPNINPKGRILNVIGVKGEHETEMQSILLDKGIVYNFPTKVEEEAQRVAEQFEEEICALGESQYSSEKTGSFSAEKVPPSRASRAPKVSLQNIAPTERADFRNVTTFTIDPVDAKDFDDALSYEEIDQNTLRIGVHIADVSHFVRPGSELDREARERSFSVYLVDRTIPMLPEVLSNNLCSLNPNVDRFAFSAVFDIEKQSGKVLKTWFGKSIINSDKRFSYEEAQEYLDMAEKSFSSESPRVSSSKDEARLSSENFLLPLQELMRLSRIYREENKKNGAIEFETDEVKFELDEQGKPIRVYKKERVETMKMIEEWMLLANRAVAKYIADKSKERGGAGLFRIHDVPNIDRLENLSIFVRALGHEFFVGRDGVSGKEINKMLKAISGHTSESLIKTAAIRSMAKAIYSAKNIGHFGLSFDYYTHFTSPIRRYPDLIVHRILQNYLTNGKTSKNDFEKFERIGMEASDKEVVVQEAERDSIKYKQVEYMVGKVGQEFECTISGVTEFGMFVEDPLTKAEGLIRLRDMEGDSYSLDEKNYCIVGAKTKKKYFLGDSLRVRLMAADLDRKTLDFKII